MFGDVGGLNDFIGLILSSIFGFFAESFLKSSMVSALFGISKTKRKNLGASFSFSSTLASIKAIKFNSIFSLLQAISCGKSACGDRKHYKVLQLGSARLEK